MPTAISSLISNLDYYKSLGNIFTYNSFVTSHFITHPCRGAGIAWILVRLPTVLTCSGDATQGPFISFFATAVLGLFATGCPRHIPTLFLTKETCAWYLQNSEKKFYSNKHFEHSKLSFKTFGAVVTKGRIARLGNGKGRKQWSTQPHFLLKTT